MNIQQNDHSQPARCNARVWTQKIICSMVLLFGFVGAAHAQVTQLFYHEVLRQYEQGAVAYEGGDYESAYADLSLAAVGIVSTRLKKRSLLSRMHSV